MIKSELLLNITRYANYFSPDIALFWDFFFWCTVFLDIFTLLIFSFLLLQDYKQCFEGAGTNPGEKTLEDKFFEYEVSRFFLESEKKPMAFILLYVLQVIFVISLPTK